MKTLAYIALAGSAPMFASAAADLEAFMDFSTTIDLTNTVVLWSSIVLAVGAIGMVLHMAYQMKGGVFSKVLYFFAAGMVVTFLGFLVETFPQYLPELLTESLGDTLFIVGYMLMAAAASKLAHAFKQ